TSGVSIGHISPEAAEGGLIGLIEDGDRIVIDVDKRLLELDVPEEELTRRRDAKGALPWRPEHRERQVSQALKVYAHLVRSATDGAARRPLDCAGPPARPVARSGHLVSRAGGGLAWGHADDPARSSRARLTPVRPYELSSAPLPEPQAEGLFRASDAARGRAGDRRSSSPPRPQSETTKEFR